MHWNIWCIYMISFSWLFSFEMTSTLIHNDHFSTWIKNTLSIFIHIFFFLSLCAHIREKKNKTISDSVSNHVKLQYEFALIFDMKRNESTFDKYKLQLIFPVIFPIAWEEITLCFSNTLLRSHKAVNWFVT